MPAESRRIWVVDDDRSVRFVLATALREAGYVVDAFEDAASVLAALDRGALPELLFTDVRMPGDDGLVLLEKLKSALPDLPVVVMSAFTDIASTAGAFRGGVATIDANVGGADGGGGCCCCCCCCAAMALGGSLTTGFGAGR